MDMLENGNYGTIRNIGERYFYYTFKKQSIKGFFRSTVLFFKMVRVYGIKHSFFHNFLKFFKI